VRLTDREIASVKPGVQQDRHADRHRQWVRAQRANLSDWGLIVRVLRALARTGVPAVLAALWLFAVVVRLGAQDNAAPLLAYYYYATPPPVLAAGAALLALGLLLVRRRRLALAALAGMLLCAVWTWGTLCFRHSPPPAGAQPLRVLFWNVDWGNATWEAIIAAIRDQNADIVALVEACNSFDVRGLSDVTIRQRAADEAAEMRALWQARMPEYHAHQCTGGGTLLIRGECAEPPREGVLTPGGACSYGQTLLADVVTKQGRLQVLGADVNGALGLTRAWPLRDLADAVSTLKDRPLLLVGDMNAPLDSPQFDPLRAQLANAFETAGNGYAATWPLPFPVLALDQAWNSAGVQVLRCEAGWTRLSDHRPLELEIAIPPAP